MICDFDQAEHDENVCRLGQPIVDEEPCREAAARLGEVFSTAGTCSGYPARMPSSSPTATSTSVATREASPAPAQPRSAECGGDIRCLGAGQSSACRLGSEGKRPTEGGFKGLKFLRVSQGYEGCAGFKGGYLKG